MAPNPRRQDERIDAIYAKLPALQCRGLCSDSCGPIEMSVRERQRIEGAAGKPVTCGPGASCSMLTEDRRCSVYAIRPGICRVWGSVRSMRCHYGCRPERWLSEDEAVRIIAELDVAGGDPGGRESRLRAVLLDHLEVARAAEFLRGTTSPATLDGIADAMPRRMIDR